MSMYMYMYIYVYIYIYPILQKYKHMVTPALGGGFQICLYSGLNRGAIGGSVKRGLQGIEGHVRADLTVLGGLHPHTERASKGP